MEKVTNITKRSIIKKATNVICPLVLILVVLLYAFESHIMSYYFRIQCKSPVIFHDVRITFPKGMIYNAGKKSIVFHYWEDPNAFLYVGKMNPKGMKMQSLVQFFQEKSFHILETKDIFLFKGYPSFTISYIDTSWTYNRDIYIIPKNLCINYQGTKENYESFKDIIDSMEFLSKDK